MAGNGPPPKQADQRKRRNADPQQTEVSADGQVRGPELPALEDGESWPAMTVRWWENWRRSAQATQMADTDWDFLLDTALLHARFHQGEVSVAGELRLRVAKFGATPEDRLRLRMSIVDPDAKGDARAKPTKRGLRVVDTQAS